MNRRHHSHIIVGLVLFAAIGNFLAAYLFIDTVGQARSLDTLGSARFSIMLGFGVMLGEVEILAIWAAFGPNPIGFRLSVTSAIFLLLSISSSLGLVLPDNGSSVVGRLGVVFFVMLGFIVAQASLWIVRTALARRIALPGVTDLRRTWRVRFSIKHLLILTGVVSLPLMFFNAMSTESPGRSFVFSFRELAPLGVAVLFGIFSLAVSLPCLFLALSERLTWRWLIRLLIVVFVGPVLRYSVWAIIRRDVSAATAAKLLSNTFLTGLGATLTILAALLICRKMGYRLARETYLNV